MQLFDTHAHLDEDAFESDRDDVIERARSSGVVGIVSVGTTADSSQRTVELSRQYNGVYAAVGIQPNYVAEAQPGDWERIETLAEEDGVVAIGETGLDRYWDFAPFDQQQEYFERHLALARQRDLPFIVHCRESERDVVSQLQAAAAGGTLSGVMHSFCGDLETARECLKLGLYISFAGMLTFKKNDELRAVAAEIPLDRLLIETDAPYLAPQPKRGKRNEPALVEHTLRCLAEVRDLSPDELAAQTTSNARRLFKLEKPQREE